ncbi:tetratricopeptide repeat protein [Oceanidesulfovibrio indonesiensis]|uniref:Tetratricopeptide repeat protein n=1 Tax=Oceanidesulfovibrio indonesiensis TaxID=54767 RepID=A0A7M3MBZ2_9BACT|nr:tetratricopeptide repeat protein [Oceanidesulfovibrio indonesiensis]TVM15828.1 tetratricopeptide repeat protein [Oceanidesulfovibrio indonesiensis]
MPAKIESLREILELDPTSKLFFPLARLLHEEGSDIEARDLLRQGLSHHPEHLEARLYLIEVLDELGEDQAAQETAEDVARVLAGSTAFWRCWARGLEGDPEQRELSFAVQFVAARLADEPVSWVEVLSRGLRSLKGEPCEAKLRASSRPSPSRRPRRPAAPPAEPVRCPYPDTVEEMTLEHVDESERSEVFSLRTRTMADLLSRQGDFDGAIEIYRELLSSTPSGPMRDELEGLIETTQRKKGERSAKPPAPEKSQEAATAKKSRKKLLSTLESLAERLEARAAE